MPKPLPLLSLLILSCAFPLHVQALEKWLYEATNLLVDKNVSDLEILWRRAAAAGCSHVLLADSKFAHLQDMDARYYKNVARVKALASELHLQVVPALFSIGYSNDLLSSDINLVEGQPVRNQPLIIRGGVAVLDSAAAPALPSAGFGDLKKWSWKDDSISTDQGAARISNAGGTNARIVQKLKLQPWREYHVSVRVKTHDFHGQPEIKALPTDASGISLQWNNLGVKPTQDWTLHHAVFNSLQYADVSLFFGVWGAGTGSLWWDQPHIEEVAFLNLVRRPGAPLAVTTIEGEPLREGEDFDQLSDPLMGAKPWKGEYDTWHQPPVLHSKLPEGTRLLASYMHAVTVYDHQAAICLSEPKTYELLRQQAQQMHALWEAKAYMMSHDELRVANWCDACQGRNLTPGGLLADNVRRCIAILREVNPGGGIYVWSDMFDPNHNATKGPYYLVNGPLTGSWEGLDKEVRVIPWYMEKRAASLAFFAGRGHHQVIAGYYDADPERVRDWLSAARGVSGVEGVMYTTWRSDYRQLERFNEIVDQAK